MIWYIDTKSIFPTKSNKSILLFFNNFFISFFSSIEPKITNNDLEKILSFFNFFINSINLSIGHVFPIQLVLGATKINFLNLLLKKCKFLKSFFVCSKFILGGRFFYLLKKRDTSYFM